jgi:type II secretory pathway pseudopilin PulG
MRRSSSQSQAGRAASRVELLLVVVILCAAGWFIVPAISESKTVAARQECLANLGQIGKAMKAYLTANDNTWPYVAKLRSSKLHDPPWPTLPVVLESYLPADPSPFRCPADRRTLSADSPLLSKFSSRTTWFETEGTSYESWMGDAYGGRKVGQETRSEAKGFGMGLADQPLLLDFELFHEGPGGGSFNTLFADLVARPARSGKDARR